MFLAGLPERKLENICLENVKAIGIDEPTKEQIDNYKERLEKDKRSSKSDIKDI